MLHHHHHHLGPGHTEGDCNQSGGIPRTRIASRFLAAGLALCVAVLAACVAIVRRGEAVIITRLGDPVRVISEPGLLVKMPAPIDAVNRIDLRLQLIAQNLLQLGETNEAGISVDQGGKLEPTGGDPQGRSREAAELRRCSIGIIVHGPQKLLKLLGRIADAPNHVGLYQDAQAVFRANIL